MSSFHRRLSPGIFATACLAAVVSSAAGAADVAFNRDIRPILADRCFACHGPGSQEAGLRLDNFAAATAVLDSGQQAIVPGDLEASELLSRITNTDPDVVMPPPHTNKPLTAVQQSLLQQWVEAGASYEQHWAFQPITRPVVPPGPPAAGPHPIDRFLETRRTEAALPINGEADRPTLIRRLSFALTGLPPTVAEVDAYLADERPGAYARLVDRLLASPHYGEEMARHWLDVARYADTHGLHLDNERQMWAYRDWVVQAFNDNLPYDAFTVWQLAGDLLPESTRSQKVATGFLRCNVTTSEGGSIGRELLFRYAVDRTATTLNAFLGLTGQCAVCHDHKFDPLSQREFYSLYAFFNSAADPGMDGNKLLTPPVLLLPTDDQTAELAAMRAARPALDKAVNAILETLTYTDPTTLSPRPPAVAREQIWLDDEFPPGAVVESGPGKITWQTGNRGNGVFAGQRSLERTASGIGQDFYSRGAEPLVIAEGEELFAHVWLDPANPPASIMLQFNVNGWNHRVVWGDPEAIAWGTLGTASRHHAGPLPPLGEWTRLTVPAAAVGLAAGTNVTGFACTQFDGHLLWDQVGCVHQYDAATDPTQSLSAWWAARVGQKNLNDLPAPLRNPVRAGPEKTTQPNQLAAIRHHWLTRVWSGQPVALRQAVAAVKANEAATKQIDDTIARTFVFADVPTRRDSFVMTRGNYDQPGERVTRDTPAFLPPLPAVEGRPPNRLDLAHWLTGDAHPLTARVAANRLWQQFFGTGLVKTSEDFGLQGEPPSHPALLDWLAAEYRDSGWDTRHMVRLLVTSRGFRRESAISPLHQQLDPENRLFGRGPRFRLDAEQIRDNALAVSGLLVTTTGGKGSNPYQPPNIWEPVGYGDSNTRYYKQSTGPDLYRRSLYVFLKRTAPPPFMASFDAPNREQFCARRERSNTPLQALQLMNDTQHIEAARELAADVLTSAAATEQERIALLYRTILARPATAREQTIVASTLRDHRLRYAAETDAATNLISHGGSPVPEDLPAPELAAWTLAANMLLNLDETLCRN